MKPTAAQSRAFEQTFEYLNDHLFDGTLPACMLTFTHRAARSDGHFSPDAWSNERGETRHGITLNPAVLRRAPADAVSVIARFMALLWQHTDGTSSRPGYYNRAYAVKLASIGIRMASAGMPGGAATGTSMTFQIVPGGKFERVFALMPEEFYLPYRSTDQPNRPARRDKLAYKCIGCSVKAWGKPGLEMLCGCSYPLVAEGASADAELSERVLGRLKDRLDRNGGGTSGA